MTKHSKPHFNRSISLTSQGYAYALWLDARRKLVAQVAGKPGWRIE